MRRAQAAFGVRDLEAHGLTLVKRTDFRGHIRAVKKYIAAAVVADQKSVTLGLVEKFDLAGIHVGSPAMLGLRNAGAASHEGRRRGGVWKSWVGWKRGGRNSAKPACARWNAAKTAGCQTAYRGNVLDLVTMSLIRRWKIFFSAMAGIARRGVFSRAHSAMIRS
jgi:hypothetical protein